MIPEGVFVYNRKKQKVQFVNQFAQQMFIGKDSGLLINDKNAEQLLKQVKLKYKAYGEQEEDVPKGKILDLFGVMQEMSKGQRTFGHQLFDLKFDLEKHYKVIEDKKIICVKSDQMLIKNKNLNERMQKYFGDLSIFMIRDVTAHRQI